MNIRYAILALFLFGLLAVSGPQPARAADELDFDDDATAFSVTGAVPGQSWTKKFCAQNDHDEEAGDFYLDVEDLTDGPFADKIKFFLSDTGTGHYFIGGSGDRYTLKEVNEDGNVFIQRLDPGEENCYRLRLTFDKDAGNEFQGRKTVFDAEFNLVSELAEGEEPLRPGVPSGGVAPTGEEAAAEAALEETVAGAATEEAAAAPEEGVLGASDQRACADWPLWVWVLILLAQAVLSQARRVSDRVSEQAWIAWAAIIPAAAALLIWYFYDACQSFSWVPIAAAAIAALSYYWRSRNAGSR